MVIMQMPYLQKKRNLSGQGQRYTPKYMKQIPIPTNRVSLIPFDSWLGLGKPLKKVYEQPLQYLTNVLLKQWDQERMIDEESQSLDSVIHPSKAEAVIHLARLRILDPMYQPCIDSVIPKLSFTV